MSSFVQPSLHQPSRSCPKTASSSPWRSFRPPSRTTRYRSRTPTCHSILRRPRHAGQKRKSRRATIPSCRWRTRTRRRWCASTSAHRTHRRNSWLAPSPNSTPSSSLRRARPAAPVLTPFPCPRRRPHRRCPHVDGERSLPARGRLVRGIRERPDGCLVEQPTQGLAVPSPPDCRLPRPPSGVRGSWSLVRLPWTPACSRSHSRCPNRPGRHPVVVLQEGGGGAALRIHNRSRNKLRLGPAPEPAPDRTSWAILYAGEQAKWTSIRSGAV